MTNTKTCSIIGSNGKPKESWEEVRCESVDVHPSGLVCFYSNDQLMIAYKLAGGEALIYQYEENKQ